MPAAKEGQPWIKEYHDLRDVLIYADLAPQREPGDWEARYWEAVGTIFKFGAVILEVCNDITSQEEGAGSLDDLECLLNDSCRKLDAVYKEAEKLRDLPPQRDRDHKAKAAWFEITAPKGRVYTTRDAKRADGLRAEGYSIRPLIYADLAPQRESVAENDAGDVICPHCAKTFHVFSLQPQREPGE